jgi:signal transduction histidine kinase
MESAPGATPEAEIARLRQVITDLERRLQAARAAPGAELQAENVRRQREAEELARVARLVNETLDLPTVSARIADGALGMLHVHSSAIRLLEPDGSLKAIALGGRAKEHAANFDVVPPGVGLIGWAALEGRPTWTEDFRADRRFQATPEIRARNASLDIVAGLAVPLRQAGKVIGVLSVGHAAPRAFTESEVELLQGFADHAAVAISNAQTQETLAKQAQRLQILHEIDRGMISEQAPQAIAEAALRPLRDLLGVPRAIVNLFDMEAGQVEWLAAVGRRRFYRGPGVRYPIALAGDLEALRRGEPQIVDVDTLPTSTDAEALLASGVHEYMVVPMVVGGELIGSVSFGGERGQRFPPEQVGIAQEVATQLAIAVVQARLLERVKRQAAELERRVEERTQELRAATAEADRANQAKSEFLSRMSHELRTPLNAILGFAQLLELDATSAEQRESVEQILRGGRHLLNLINEVLEISRIEARRLQLSLEPVPIRETLRQAIELIQPSAGAARVSVRADAIDEGLHVRADRQRLQQVLLNLLSNGIKYNRPNGIVTISTEAMPEGRLRLRVADTGEGIAPDKLARLFTPFDRLGAEASAVEGTGLGLALSKSLVEAMGGTLRVQSQQGVGSTFSIELAMVPAPSVAHVGPAVVEAPVSDGAPRARKILYIEDNLSNLALVEGILSRRVGTTVLSAMQGRVGIALARDHQPDLILLDRHLPDISGDEVFRLLRDDPLTRKIPVIVLSADALPSRMRLFQDAGVPYLTKPLDVRGLLAAVDDSLRKSPP